MIAGFDYSKGSRTVCISKHFESSGAHCAIVLSADGTGQAPDALMDGVQPALEKTAAMLMQQVEQAAGGSGADDMVFISTYLISACKKINRMILDISDYLGQGIYIGGVIMYHIAGRYQFLVFGGGAVYSFRDGTLIREGSQIDDPFVRNALGGSDNWDCDLLQGVVENDVRYILTSRPLPDEEKAANMICDIGMECSHPNTVPMLLVRELSVSSPYPAAVMEIRLT